MPTSRHGQSPAPILLTGRDLRYAVLITLDRRFGLVRTIDEILDDLAYRGLAPDAERPGKALADAMRWEVRRGRVLRSGWGRYKIGHYPATTQWRAENRIDHLRRSRDLTGMRNGIRLELRSETDDQETDNQETDNQETDGMAVGASPHVFPPLSEFAEQPLFRP
jgi:hypothetical protein